MDFTVRELTQYEKRFAAIVTIVVGVTTLTVVLGITWLTNFLIGVSILGGFVLAVWAVKTVLNWVFPGLK